MPARLCQTAATCDRVWPGTRTCTGCHNIFYSEDSSCNSQCTFNHFRPQRRRWTRFCNSPLNDVVSLGQAAVQLPHASKSHQRVQRVEMVAGHKLDAGPKRLQRIEKGETEGQRLEINVSVPVQDVTIILCGKSRTHQGRWYRCCLIAVRNSVK